MAGTRKRHPAAFKARGALETAKQTKTVVELAKAYQVHPVQISQWKKQLLDFATHIVKRIEGPETSSARRRISSSVKGIARPRASTLRRGGIVVGTVIMPDLSRYQ